MRQLHPPTHPLSQQSPPPHPTFRLTISRASTVRMITYRLRTTIRCRRGEEGVNGSFARVWLPASVAHRFLQVQHSTAQLSMARLPQRRKEALLVERHILVSQASVNAVHTSTTAAAQTAQPAQQAMKAAPGRGGGGTW